MRAPQRLADIYIAETGNVLLVKQRALQRLRLVPEAFGQIGGAEFVSCRLRAEIAEEGMGGEIGTSHHIHETETARIVIDDTTRATCGLQMEDDVIVLLVLRSGMVEFARHAGGGSILNAALLNAKRTRHAEMRNQRVAVVEIDQQIFGAAAKADDGAAGNPVGESIGKGEAQIAAAQLQLGDAGALHRRRQAAFHRFDFWQFRHLNPSISNVFQPATMCAIAPVCRGECGP